MAVHVGQVKKACSIISKAKRPLFLLGGGVSISGANQLMMDLIEKTGIPVVTTLMGKGAVDTRPSSIPRQCRGFTVAMHQMWHLPIVM